MSSERSYSNREIDALKETLVAKIDDSDITNKTAHQKTLTLSSVVLHMTHHAQSQPVCGFSLVFAALIRPVHGVPRSLLAAMLTGIRASKFLSYPVMEARIAYLLSFPRSATCATVSVLLAVLRASPNHYSTIRTLRPSALPPMIPFSRCPRSRLTPVPGFIAAFGYKVAPRRTVFPSTSFQSCRLNEKNYTTYSALARNTVSFTHILPLYTNVRVYA